MVVPSRPEGCLVKYVHTAEQQRSKALAVESASVTSLVPFSALAIAAATVLAGPGAGAAHDPLDSKQADRGGTPGFATSPHAMAQSPFRFGVASVKATDGVSRSAALFDPQPGGFSASNVPLARLIEYAYGRQPYVVVGGPEWISKERFSIVAKYPAGWSLDRPGGRAEVLQMLQALLADRFSLRVHNETLDSAIYNLVMHRQDRQIGSQLRQVPNPCLQGSSGEAKERGLRPCQLLQGRSALELNGQPVSYITSRLSAIVGALVVDRTGLTGFYDLRVQWAPEQGAGNAATIDQVSIFTAIQEQLGLRLERARGPVDMLVIDSVDRPTPD